MSEVTSPIILNSTGQDIALALAGLATAIANKPAPATQTPVMDGAGDVGASVKYAREDHQHPSDTSKANQSQLATVESSSTASRAYAVGEYFCLAGLLYRAIQPIANGGTFTPGTNCEQKYVTGMAVRWVDISGTSGGSSAVSVTALSGVNSVSGIILAVVDNDATVTSALSLSLYKSGNSWGAALVDMNGNRKANTAFNLRLYYVLI